MNLTGVNQGSSDRCDAGNHDVRRHDNSVSIDHDAANSLIFGAVAMQAATTDPFDTGCAAN